MSVTYMHDETASDPNVTIDGSVHDDGGECILSATEVDNDVLDDGGSTVGTLSYNMRSDLEGNFMGSGSVSLSGGIDCSQNFTIIGTIN